MIHWAICDDAEYLCKSFEWAFEKEPDLVFDGFATDEQSCLELVKEKRPEILLQDIQMEEPTTGIEIIPKLKEIVPDLKIIMLTNYDDDNYVFSAFVNGATDYVLKTLPNGEILQALRNVSENKTSLRPEIAKKLVQKSSEIQKQNLSLVYSINMLTKLSTSEFEVLRQCYYGESYKQIAEERFVDVSTIRTLASRIIKKFEYDSMKNLVKALSKLKVFEYLDSQGL
ncbi:response regulator transcription factor [Lachnotalea sp. AF33-28]|jgi:DNA-binding NarL/FixJ family response regulator|uniref:response regulator transcription factor n=1 Tax=Lachnotalea sp. AF33-28 TaxID=2292046 RepID=UPI000E51795E|nr:response regulator transcription factor [Lachnotalea sp. AF33-28]RHP34819.1 DNA-binding response regulator [Lachnotalea sp. AF33-28]